jgi:Pro-kumamolisin, activation domain
LGTLSCVAFAVASASALASPGRHELRGTAPRWLTRAHDLGATPSANQVQFGVVLHMRDQAGAEAALQAVSEPSSAKYGQWLSNAAFNAAYAPSRADVAAVQDWLRSQGFTVTKTLPSGMLVEASGSVAQVQQTFGAQLHNYSYQGATVRANTAALSLPGTTPAAVTGAIAGVIGIDQGSTLKQPADTEPGPPPGSRYGVQPCSDYFGQKIASDKLPTVPRSHTRCAVTCPSSSSRPTGRPTCSGPASPAAG